MPEHQYDASEVRQVLTREFRSSSSRQLQAGELRMDCCQYASTPSRVRGASTRMHTRRGRVSWAIYSEGTLDSGGSRDQSLETGWPRALLKAGREDCRLRRSAHGGYQQEPDVVHYAVNVRTFYTSITYSI